MGYFIGSIPFGLIIVKVATGKDIRDIQSGRTGGTNAMRAAGFWAGLSTALCDILKSASGVWITRAILPHNPWLDIFVALATILGHNYSIFLIKRGDDGKLRLGGGAGGATTAGGATALWPPILLIIIPVGALLLFVLGYASVATMSIATIAMVVFAIRAALGISPWIYVLYGLLAEIILIWALRPNIKRLLNGTERIVGLRAQRSKTQSETVLKNP
jgi:glycerol-3-phosphate acyltransferase PlsY